MGLKKRDPDGFDLEDVAGATDAYTGADIEQVVITGLKLAFHAGSELGDEHLLDAVPEARPLSETDPERVAAMAAWLARHTKPASGTREMSGACVSNGTNRKRRVAV